MSFDQYITPKLVKINSPASTKTAVLTEIVRMFLTNNSELNESELFTLFWQREQLGSTSIGHGTAIPHVRCPSIQLPSTACLRLKHPIDFGGIDRQPCDLFIALIVPEDEHHQHLALLRSISEKLQQPNFRENCRHALTNEDFFEVLTAIEPQIA